MDYDVVVATRNRPEALRLSIPPILGQGRPPYQLIIVDASDNHEQVHRSVIETVGDSPVQVKILYSQQPNIALQRNMGIDCVKSSIVMFTDDDSIWWPGYGEAIMRIYERDTRGCIGGVCGTCVAEPPPQTHLAGGAGYTMRLSDRIRQKIEFPYNKFVSRFCPDPFWIHGRSRWNVQPIPNWLSEENSCLVEYMGGGRMSFRTEIIQSRGLDDDLGSFLGYSKSEDTEVCFFVMQKWLIIGTHNAKVYHHKHPAIRGDGFKLGFISQLNPVYVLCKHSPQGSAARRAVKRYSVLALLQRIIRVRSKFHFDYLRGVLMAIRHQNKLLNAPPERLRQSYLDLCQKVLQTN